MRSAATLFCLWVWVGPAGLLRAGDLHTADAIVANVTASGFTVFWQDANEGAPEVRIYTAADLSGEVTADLRREAFPLAERPRPHWSADRRAAVREFRATVRDGGFRTVRVSNAAPDTEYFVQPGYRDSGGAFQPLPGGAIEVTTAAVTGFVADYRQVVFRFPAEAIGTVAVLDLPGARAPLLALVGDGSGGEPEAVFPLGDLVGDATGTPLLPGGGLLNLEVAHYSGPAAPAVASAQLETDGNFRVAGFISRLFEAVAPFTVAYFTFDPVDDAMAGQPFMVRVTARTADDAIDTSFDAPVTLTSDGRLETDSETPAFTDGVLEGHAVAIGNTGEFRLFAAHTPSGAEGESAPFTVSTDWANWFDLFGDNALDSITEQRLDDPGDLGLPSLVRYAFDLDPEAPDPAGLVSLELDPDADPADQVAAITFRRLQDAPDVRYVVQGSDDLDTWATVAVVAPGAPEWVTVSDNVSLAESGGSRFLRVNVVGDGNYDFWVLDQFAPSALDDPALSGRDADPDGAGFDLFTRYALGMDATDPDLSNLPETTRGEDDRNRITFTRLASGHDVRYTVEATENFVDWEVIETLEPGLPETVEITDPTPVPDGGFRILRMRITPLEDAP